MRTISQHDAEKAMLQTPRVEQLRHWSKLYSSGPHLAGDLAHAERIRDLWASYGIRHTKLLRYDVLQNFPREAALQLHTPDGSGVAFEADLTEPEPQLPEDPTSAPTNGLPAFHGFSANGAVTAELVYANFGTPSDFRTLATRGVSVRGRIVIVKYAKVFRGLKVRAAQEAGAAAIVMYNDPQEDGEITTRNGYAAYPHGPARHPRSVQRGSVDFFSVAVGDPTTPGRPSLPGDGTDREDPRGRDAIPRIPSLPISYADAVPLLRALDGEGLAPEELGVDDWKGDLEGVGYWTGPSRVKVTLRNEGEYRYSPIYNVVGEIPGRTDETVILGSHHDSWCCGAVDPVSGCAALNEVARGLGVLLDQHWRPFRKIVLASWDNEEYGLVGSTEYGEQYASELSKNCVAYINVDESTNGGKILGAVGSPLLAKALNEVTRIIPSPIHEGLSIYDDWRKNDLAMRDAGSDNISNLGCMGTGSDYTVFFHHLGIPSLDLVFNKRGDAVYPYHSNYDSYHWLDRFGDPGFRKHLAMARLWGVLAVRLAGVPLIAFRASDYADALRLHFQALRSRDVPRLDLETTMATSIDKFAAAAGELDRRAAAALRSRDTRNNGLQEINRRYKDLERRFLLGEGDGLPGRPWYRHCIFAPGLWYGYDGVVFPGIVESLENGDLEAANGWAGRTAEILDGATALLRM